jgi:hypothetical protein
MPQGDFVEVTPLRDGWEIKFRMLAGQKQPIKFDMYPKRNIPPELDILLTQEGYHDLVLENDRWQHFLMPKPIETPSNRA